MFCLTGKSGSVRWLVGQTRWILLASIVGGFSFSLFYGNSIVISEVLAMALVFWIVLTMVADLHNKTRKVRKKTGLLVSLQRLKPAYYGMHLAHLGLAVTIVGIAIVSGYSSQRDLRMAPGDRVNVGAYQFRFDGVRPQPGPNYSSDYGTVTVYDGGRQIAALHPEKRVYVAQGMPMTEAAIDPGVTRDVYVALGEPLGNDGSWAVRIHIKPFVRWIWFGSILMGLGGMVAIADRRYRVRVGNKMKCLSSSGKGPEDVKGGVASV